MISRIWHGYTTPLHAEAYENLLRDEIFAWIASKNIPGYQGIQLYRRELGEEVEFITIMWFDSIDSVKAFAGEDYETAVVLPQAQALLARYDALSQHYEVRVDLKS
jgi:antibiotic biosynthesis monooxygenase (ABM) superfamily enzyme